MKKKYTLPSNPDSKLIFSKPSLIQYEQIFVDTKFRQYLERIMVSKKDIADGNPKNSHKKMK